VAFSALQMSNSNSNKAKSEASAAVLMRSALFWAVNAGNVGCCLPTCSG
jgi:hypothetical protein